MTLKVVTIQRSLYVWSSSMKYNSLKNIMLVLACVGTFLFPTLTADAAELSAVVSAGVATAMEQVDDETVLAAATAPSVVEGYSLLGVVTAEKGYINIREEMSTESDVVGKIRKDGICEVVSIEEDWCEIESGEIKGYISSEYLLSGADANEKAEELLAEGKELETAITMMEYRYGKGVTDIQMEICEYARQFVGNPYRWGAQALQKVLTVPDLHYLCMQSMGYLYHIPLKHRQTVEKELTCLNYSQGILCSMAEKIFIM